MEQKGYALALKQRLQLPRWQSHSPSQCRRFCRCACPGTAPTLGHKEIFRGHWGTIEAWAALGAGPVLPEQVMCHKCTQSGWVGARLGRRPVELGRGDGGGLDGRQGNAGTRLTEAFMLEGASADKKTQGTAVSLRKDGGDLCHLGFYLPGNGSHPWSVSGDFRPADLTDKFFNFQRRWLREFKIFRVKSRLSAECFSFSSTSARLFLSCFWFFIVGFISGSEATVLPTASFINLGLATTTL